MDDNTEITLHLSPCLDYICDQDPVWGQRRSFLPIPQQISEPIQLQARHMFLNDTVVLTPNSRAVSQGHFANLASLLRPAKPNALGAAVDAVALSLLATRFGMFEARSLAVAQYTSSIRHLRKQELTSTDSTQCIIACISLLSLYEVRSIIGCSHVRLWR